MLMNRHPLSIPNSAFVSGMLACIEKFKQLIAESAHSRTLNAPRKFLDCNLSDGIEHPE